MLTVFSPHLVYSPSRIRARTAALCPSANYICMISAQRFIQCHFDLLSAMSSAIIFPFLLVFDRLFVLAACSDIRCFVRSRRVLIWALPAAACDWLLWLPLQPQTAPSERPCVRLMLSPLSLSLLLFMCVCVNRECHLCSYSPYNVHPCDSACLIVIAGDATK